MTPRKVAHRKGKGRRAIKWMHCLRPVSEKKGDRPPKGTSKGTAVASAGSGEKKLKKKITSL